MQKTFIWIIVLVLISLGIVLFLGKGNKLEAPAPLNNEVSTPVVENTLGELKEFTITAKNYSFAPSTIKVNKGDRVKITFVNSEGFHDFRIDELDAATSQTKSPATEVLEFTASQVGSFVYYCSVGTHRAMGMLGTLVVE